MNKKLYYDTQIVATYMVEEFDVEYAMPCGKCGIEGNEFNIEIEMLKLSDEYTDGEPIYIHPDSYSIFEPKEGDKIGNDRDSLYVCDFADDIENGCELWCARELMEKHGWEIEKRDNKHFFMPKTEEVEDG